jgi:hypothetical protein
MEDREMGTATAPGLDATVAQARKLARIGLVGATGLARSRWVVAGIMLAIVGFAIARLINETDEVRLKLALAPVDDEPVTPEEHAALDAARSEPDIPWEQAKKKLASRARSVTST